MDRKPSKPIQRRIRPKSKDTTDLQMAGKSMKFNKAKTKHNNTRTSIPIQPRFAGDIVHITRTLEELRLVQYNKKWKRN